EKDSPRAVIHAVDEIRELRSRSEQGGVALAVLPLLKEAHEDSQARHRSLLEIVPQRESGAECRRDVGRLGSDLIVDQDKLILRDLPAQDAPDLDLVAELAH